MQGLERILQQIAQDSTNRVLIDRFLMLVKELDKEEDKARFVLKLARQMIEVNPTEAMQYSYLVFQYDRTSVKALEIVVDCLKSLGRYAKAEVIGNELSRLRAMQVKVPNPPKEKRGSFSTETTDVDVDGVSLRMSPQSSVFSNQSISSKHSRDKLLKDGPRPPVAPTISLTEMNEPAETLAPAPPLHMELEVPKATVAPRAGLGWNAKSSAAQEPPSESPESVPIASAPTEWEGPELGVILELFDFYWRHGLLSEARDLIASTEKFASEMPWWKARKAIIGRYEHLLGETPKPPEAPVKEIFREEPSRIEHTVASAPHPAPLTILKDPQPGPKMTLAKDLSSALGEINFVKALVAERKYRRAVVHMFRFGEQGISRELWQELLGPLQIALGHLGYAVIPRTPEEAQKFFHKAAMQRPRRKMRAMLVV